MLQLIHIIIYVMQLTSTLKTHTVLLLEYVLLQCFLPF